MDNWKAEFKKARAREVPPNVVDRRGKRYGDVWPYEYLGSREFPSGQRHAVWRCRCVCGKDCLFYSGALKPNKQTCGCRPKEALSRRKNYQGVTVLGITVIDGGLADHISIRCEAGHHDQVPRNTVRAWLWEAKRGRTTPACYLCVRGG